MQGNRASSQSEGEVSFFSQVAAGTWGIFSSYGGDGPSKLKFVQRHQDSCLVSSDTPGISLMLVRATGMLLKVRRETQDPLPFATVILGFLSISKRSQSTSPFESLNSTFPSRCQRDVRPPVEMRWGPQALSRISTRDSDFPSTCKMKDEPEFKTL